MPSSHLPACGWFRPVARVLTGLVIGICLSASAASAKDFYLAQNASGAASGADCADAKAVSFFNSSSNWGTGSAQIGPGTTVHLCGTITASPLTAQGSGSSGSPVTIRFETGAKISVPFCAGNACLDLTGKNWITVDGGTTCGYANGVTTACNGTIENTANGTNLANQVSTPAIQASSTSNVEIRNLLFQNLYIHTGSTDSAVNFPNSCVDLNGVNTISIHHNIGHDMVWCFAGGGSNVSINNNDVSHVDHAVTFGSETSGQVYSNVNIYGNYFHDYANWDTGTLANHPYHHDGIQLWGLSTGGGTSSNNGQVTNIKIYDNLFGGDHGQWNTGQVYLMNSVNNVLVYNNVFTETSTFPMYGFIRTDGTAGDNAAGPISVYNNTLLGNNVGSYCVWATVQNNYSFKNNAVAGCDRPIEIDSSTIVAGGLNDNVYQQGSNFGWNSSALAFSAWQSSTGQDGSSKVVASLGVDASGNPQASAAVIGTGANLTSLGVATLDSDKAGNLRPGSGAWDAGALEPGVSAAQPAPPTSLTATVQ